MIAEDSNAENAKTAPLANASIAQPANDAFDFIASNNNEDTATCAGSNLTNTAPATKENAEENIATDDEEKIGDEGVTLSLNTVLPSFDLTAEEELKIHMLFQVREKVQSIILLLVPPKCEIIFGTTSKFPFFQFCMSYLDFLYFSPYS